MFHDSNLGKRSVALDLGRPEGRTLARRLALSSHIVIQNFSPGVMERLGLGYGVLKAERPDLLMLSISTAGSAGPARDDVGFAVIFNATGGMAHLTGYPDGPPVDIRDGTDLRVGAWSTVAALAAIYHWRQTGEGQALAGWSALRGD